MSEWKCVRCGGGLNTGGVCEVCMHLPPTTVTNIPPKPMTNHTYLTPEEKAEGARKYGDWENALFIGRLLSDLERLEKELAEAKANQMTSEEFKALTADGLRELKKAEVIYDERRLAVPYDEFMRLKSNLLDATRAVEGLISEFMPQIEVSMKAILEKFRRSIQ